MWAMVWRSFICFSETTWKNKPLVALIQAVHEHTKSCCGILGRYISAQILACGFITKLVQVFKAPIGCTSETTGDPEALFTHRRLEVPWFCPQFQNVLLKLNISVFRCHSFQWHLKAVQSCNHATHPPKKNNPVLLLGDLVCTICCCRNCIFYFCVNGTWICWSEI